MDINTSLDSLVYPIYLLGEHKPTVDNGVMYYYREKEVDGMMVPMLRVVDDKNLPYPTLAQRRLHLIDSEEKVQKIGIAIFYLGDLIKIGKKGVWFIDTVGKLFNYTKSARAKLKFYPISKLLRMNTGGVIIEVKGVSTRFKSLYAPTNGEQYAGLLHFGKSLVFYGFFDKQYDETWRMV